MGVAVRRNAAATAEGPHCGLSCRINAATPVTCGAAIDVPLHPPSYALSLVLTDERMLLPGWAEVSGVCTWPQFRRRGLAPLLMGRVMRGFAARGDRPFLHCFAHNTGAIALYEKMGFRRRAELALTVLALA